MAEHAFDLIVVGGGSAGFVAARRARHYGATVAMVEEGVLGGECPNTACVPTKALLRSTEVIEEVRRAGEFGIRVPAPTVDWPAVRGRMERIVRATGSDAETEKRLREQGIAVFRDHAELISPRGVRVGSQTLTAPHVFLTTGSCDRVPPIPGLKDAGFITHKEAIRLEKLPESLIIIGAGPVGVEFSQIFAPLGVKVTILADTPLPLHREDQDVSRLLLKSLRERGVTVETGVRVERVERRGAVKHVVAKKGEVEQEYDAGEILVAAGHAPQSDRLGLKAVGVKCSDRGIEVDDTLQTSVPGIRAAGDITGVALFTHVASYQGRLAADNAFGGPPHRADYRVVPRVTFCRPEVASVGLSEQELIDRKIEYRCGRRPYTDIERSTVSSEDVGFAKLLVEPDTGQILGAHVIGYRAGDLIHEPAVAMQNRVPVSGIRGTIHAFPNFSEIWEAVAIQLR